MAKARSLPVSWVSVGAVAGFLAVVLFAQLNPAPASAGNTADLSWKIKKDRWSIQDEQGFSAFVQAIGDSGCRSIDQCIKHEANPYSDTDPSGMRYFSDCADLPYFLRAYYAWRNQLPFSYVIDVEAAPTEGGSRDIRYSKEGNLVVRRSDVTTEKSGKFPNGIQTITRIGGVISSAMFRFHPRVPEQKDLAKRFPDFYPVKIDRRSIVPGTIIYDPNGHVAVVYRVRPNGRILYMDAHPDNSLTRGAYGQKFARSRPGMGAGFKNWRPIRLEGAKLDEDSNWIGGTIVGNANSEIPDYSAEQFFGTHPDPSGSWNRGKFIRGGSDLVYYDYVRAALSQGDLKYDPIEEVRTMVDDLCQDLKDRVEAVQLAVGKTKIHLRSHPSRLPENIYGTSGDWESFSTPSRDARLKTSFRELRERVEEFVKKHHVHDPSIVYTGRNLREDLISAYRERSAACRISYRKSDGTSLALSFEQARERLFLMSFDPYHCPELRWGASSSSELASCADNSLKRRWYVAEQRLRNQIERDYEDKMDFTVDELEKKPDGSGVDSAPDVDVLRFLGAGS